MNRANIESYSMGFPDLLEIQILKVRDTNFILWHAFPEELRGIGSIIRSPDGYDLRSHDSPTIESSALLAPGTSRRYDYSIQVCSDRMISRIERVFEDLPSMSDDLEQLDHNPFMKTKGVRLVSEDKLDAVLFLRDRYVGIILLGIDCDSVETVLGSGRRVTYNGNVSFTFQQEGYVSASGSGFQIGWGGNLVSWRAYISYSAASRVFDKRLSAFRCLISDLDDGCCSGIDQSESNNESEYIRLRNWISVNMESARSSATYSNPRYNRTTT